MKRIIATLAIAVVCLCVTPKLSAQIVEQTFSDGISMEENISERTPISIPGVRTADVMWKKRVWREIDFRQKINQPFYYPTTNHQDWKNFITVVMDGIKEGRIQAYEVEPTDEFLTPLSYNQFIVSQSDTSYKTLRRPYPPYEEYDTMMVSQFDPAQVMRLRIKEDWYFDRQRSQLMVRIIALCPVKMREIEGGEKAPQPLFWIPYESARQVFAEAIYFNRNNSAAQFSYDDVFWKRMFDSYIYKEENVHDRSIREYAQGLDALLESERIKQSIIDFEQNLWDY